MHRSSEMTSAAEIARRLPVGAELVAGRGVHFRVWAPRRQWVEVIFDDGREPVQLKAEGNGYHSGFAEGLTAGALYRFRLDGSQQAYPDPVSRFQPQGVHGPSQVVDPASFRWTDDAWPGVAPDGQVLYELHVGTFTPEGTWSAAMRELPALAEVGVTCVEMMPVCDFAGRFGWGYDGVDLFAPTHLYGTPDDLRAFIDRAHALGIGVILDVVYNHLGPDGNVLPEFSEDYFTDKHKNDWGKSLNFDGENNAPVREFFLANAGYWIEEFHFDGYRFDATQAILDDSPTHILAEICTVARRAGGKRKVYLINENEPQHTRLVRPVDRGGYGLDALWNDDFHHSAMVALSGKHEAYYTDHRGTPQEFISSAKYGYLFQGQRYVWQKKRRGTPALDLPPTAFVNFIQNHDQLANSGTGLRAHDVTSPGQLRAMTALLLLMPQTPMLFQGQEWAASSPFHYFADHTPEIGKLVRQGRAKEMSQFPSIATAEMQRALIDPTAEETFRASKLDHAERTRGRHAQMFQLHKDLLRLRREEPVFRRVAKRGGFDGAVLGHDAFVLRYFGDAPDGTGDRLLLVNLGADLSLLPAPEPLLAPPLDRGWSILLSTDAVRYGGAGTPAPETETEGWLLPGRCAIVMTPEPANRAAVQARRAV
jgi:maltooligosyltrehalose trehalohydrolase